MPTRRSQMWGDSVDVSIPPGGLPAGGIETRQLVNVEAPFPCTWNIVMTVQPISGAVPTAADTVVFLRVSVGIGRVLQEVPFLFQPSAPILGNIQFTNQVQNLPAQSLLIAARVNSGIIVATQLKLAVWVAPQVPWEGIEVAVVKGVEAPAQRSLEAAGKQFNVQRRVWR